ncbi:late embryogenesis abundant protein D-34-like isoform X2 [Andrographis paniculata]|uniref:late embryogenesis abundant protein D-34-like isoform X2 n=1 Tax=Andrographis paniculata TaxID=175694 RepID=UPI0021E94F1F|nr:late embryogenesis abundant protein D-34-like isoform X2 [Andrographis paniculata]
MPPLPPPPRHTSLPLSLSLDEYASIVHLIIVIYTMRISTQIPIAITIAVAARKLKMSQQQQEEQPEAVKYGDLFDVSGQLASQPIAPEDAEALLSAEKAALGQIPKGGPASVMQSAARLNQQRGLLRDHDDDTTIITPGQGATLAQSQLAGYHLITESVAGQVIGQYSQPKEIMMKKYQQQLVDPDAITIGEALEATALKAGSKAIDQSDAAAIQAAEVRATGLGHVIPGGIAAEAQSAAAHNLRTTNDRDKTKLEDILTV